MSRYLRVAVLGDSASHGVGDPVPGGWRGWAALLAQSLAMHHDLSFCNLAVPGATTASLRADQLPAALAHRPDLATLVVGLNDVLRPSFDRARVAEDLHATAGALHGAGALLLTVRFHDHPTAAGLPPWLARRLGARVAAVNDAYDAVHARWGGVRVDLATEPAVHERRSWSVDRLHPSERGHRAMAAACARALREQAGLDVPDPGREPAGGVPATRWGDVRWLLGEGVPWAGRRAREVAPWAVRAALAGARGTGTGAVDVPG